MKIVVCIKQVPDTNEVKLDPKTNRLIRDGVPSIINHDDKSGIEAALQLKEKVGGTVTVVCMEMCIRDRATSDRQEQIIALGNGAFRLSASERKGEIERTNLEISSFLKEYARKNQIRHRNNIKIPKK